jgi:DNA polymerase elongation subunit (family B)
MDTPKIQRITFDDLLNHLRRGGDDVEALKKKYADYVQKQVLKKEVNLNDDKMSKSN